MYRWSIKKSHHEFTMKKFRCISFIGIAGVIITLMVLNFANAEEETDTNLEKKGKKGIIKNKQFEEKKQNKISKKKVE